jgi:hypothetical protein
MDSFIGGVLGGLATVVACEVVKHVIGGSLARSDFLRDAIVDVITTIAGVESMLSDARAPRLAKQPTNVSELRKLPDTWRVRGPVIPLDKYLASLGDERLHRRVIVFFDQFVKLDNFLKHYSVMFYWLLDCPDEKWPTGPASERCEQLEFSSGKIRSTAFCILFRGHQLLQLLVKHANESPSVRRIHTSAADFILQSYGLSESELDERTAWYSDERHRTTLFPRALRVAE